MIIGIILIGIAIFYAVNHRGEPRKIIYTGIGLLILGAVFYTVFSIIFSNLGLHTHIWWEELMVISFSSTFLLVPAGLIMLVVGFILNIRKKR